MHRPSRLAASLAALALALTACGGNESTGESAGDGAGQLAARGRSVYMANCIACHSPDPSADGPLGPAIAGASHDLLEARVMRAEYPPGYTPKRDSKLMVAMPHLEREIEALEAYLDNAG